MECAFLPTCTESQKLQRVNKKKETSRTKNVFLVKKDTQKVASITSRTRVDMKQMSRHSPHCSTGPKIATACAPLTNIVTECSLANVLSSSDPNSESEVSAIPVLDEWEILDKDGYTVQLGDWTSPLLLIS